MIVGFNDTENFFLNNKCSCSVFILDRRFGNAEAAYQAHKTKEPQIQNIFTTLDAVSSQSIGRGVTTHETWDEDKIRVMLIVIFEKFRQNPDLLEKLIATGDQKLVSVSKSKEKLWGTVAGEGQNTLGKIIMYVRQYFKTYTNCKRESLHTNWQDIHNELELLRIPIRNDGMLHNALDLQACNNGFIDLNKRLNKLNLDMQNYLEFFIVDTDILTEATKQFTE